LADRAAFASRSAATAWLRRAYPLVVKDYSTWERRKQLAGDTGLSRYFDYGGPEPAEELGSAKYYRDVIRFLIAHPGENRGYLVRAPRHPSAAEVTRLARVSCNVRASRIAPGRGTAAIVSRASTTGAIVPCANRASTRHFASALSAARRSTTRRWG
ncbi:hypothetical protein B2A_07997, partial [mine drainage metagenome]